MEAWPVLAEPACGDSLLQILVGGADDSDIHVPGAVVPTRSWPFPEDAQELALHLERTSPTSSSGRVPLAVSNRPARS